MDASPTSSLLFPCAQILVLRPVSLTRLFCCSFPRNSYQKRFGGPTSVVSGLALELSKALETPGVVEGGRKPLTVFFDANCLDDSELWESGVLHGLAGSLMCMPLLSRVELDLISKLAPKQRDNHLIGALRPI